MPLSFNTTYKEDVPPHSSEYTCLVRGPDASTVLATATVVVRNVQGTFLKRLQYVDVSKQNFSPGNLSVWRDGLSIKNNSFIEVRGGNLNFQCFEHVLEANLTWIVLPDNGSVTVLTTGKTDIYTVTESGNQANLAIDNSFRGLIKCFSSDEMFNVRRVEGKAISNFTLDDV